MPLVNLATGVTQCVVPPVKVAGYNKNSGILQHTSMSTVYTFNMLRVHLIMQLLILMKLIDSSGGQCAVTQVYEKCNRMKKAALKQTEGD